MNVLCRTVTEILGVKLFHSTPLFSILPRLIDLNFGRPVGAIYTYNAREYRGPERNNVQVIRDRKSWSEAHHVKNQHGLSDGGRCKKKITELTIVSGTPPHSAWAESVRASRLGCDMRAQSIAGMSRSTQMP